jgi:hypothetical protein
LVIAIWRLRASRLQNPCQSRGGFKGLRIVRHLLIPALVTAAVVSACGGGSGSSAPATAKPGDPAITSQADSILHLDQLRAAGFRGAGVKVGVISTGVANLSTYQKQGTLPAQVFISQNTPGQLDEGSWMLELIHQSAPDAILGFCDGSDLDFDGCVKDLATTFGADVIVDDLLFVGQYYPASTEFTVGQLESSNDNLVFIHLSGNEQNGGYWQGDFVPLPAQVGGVAKTLLDFGVASAAPSSGFNAVTVSPNAHLFVFVSWNDAPNDPTNHGLTAYLLDSNFNELSHASGQLVPSLQLDYRNSGTQSTVVSLAVALDSGSASGLAVQFTEGAPTCNIECQPFTFSTSGLAGGTVGNFADALVVGATNAGHPQTVEPWSNHGPFRYDFSATTDAASPDGLDYLRLAAPVQSLKPDLVAPDCVTTPFANGTILSDEQFCGTSAAVPAVAAAAVLLRNAGFNRTQILKALRSTARPIGATPWDPAYGFGLVDALAAWKSGGN